MIKFFRRLRQRLLAENKLSQYLLYAAGEIILVVIGILIALQLNNWNEQRKNQETLNATYQIIKEDLLADIEEVERFVVRFAEVRKPAWDSVLFGNLTYERLRSNNNINWVFGGYEDISINIRGIDLLKSQSAAVLIDSKLSSDIAKFYNDHLVEIEIAQLELSQEFKDNGFALKQFDWVNDYFLYNKPEGYYRYLSSNPEAKRRVSTYRLYYSIYVDELKRFLGNARELITKIDKYFAT